MSHRALKSVQSFFLQRTARKKGKEREGKGRHKKSRKSYISPIRGEAPRKRIFTKFCTSEDMLDIIICAIFGVEKLRGLGNTRGQILEFPIEMARHLYNRAGATAQPVMTLNPQNKWVQWVFCILWLRRMQISRVNCVEMVGDRPKQPEKRNW